MFCKEEFTAGYAPKNSSCYLVYLSTAAASKRGTQPWVKFQSAGWVNIRSASTGTPAYSAAPYYVGPPVSLGLWFESRGGGGYHGHRGGHRGGGWDGHRGGGRDGRHR